MTDPATPAARPPYWGQCEWMSLAELDRFIHDAARRLSDPSVTDDGNTPRSHEEFWELCALLRRKVDASKQDETMLERPDYQGPPNPGYYLTPSLKLEALYRRLQKAQRRVEQAIEDHDSPTYVEYLEEEVEKVQAEIAPVEQREQERTTSAGGSTRRLTSRTAVSSNFGRRRRRRWSRGGRPTRSWIAL